ncbi:DUF4386 family protein [Phytomonospora endophytica]|uniref:DUF4386 family protein n=1 Tax=Phytomonospora endophytica TaxID=714109 RepID=A0A841FFV2_9ACTN|nr:DUF4386 family protein [Phytomonospora endophytica]MBB6032718.1 hypothetical protein [Phytomonospora endophytica]GIG66133.1 hypothetical protein Pen01_24280 [Phytomonospora endophytica]
MPRKLNTPELARSHGLAGVGFAALIVLGNAVLVPAGMPVTGTETGEVLAFFAGERTAVGLAAALTPLTWVLAALFGAGAVRALWDAEHERRQAWALAGLAGLILQNALFAVVIAIRLALASTEHSEDAARALWSLHDAVFTLNGTFLALAMVGLSLAGLRAGLIPRWHAALGMTGAALQFTSASLAALVIDHAGPLGLIGLTGWLLWVVWIAAYGLTLARVTPWRRAAAS